MSGTTPCHAPRVAGTLPHGPLALPRDFAGPRARQPGLGAVDAEVVPVARPQGPIAGRRVQEGLEHALGVGPVRRLFAVREGQVALGGEHGVPLDGPQAEPPKPVLGEQHPPVVGPLLRAQADLPSGGSAQRAPAAVEQLDALPDQRTLRRDLRNDQDAVEWKGPQRRPRKRLGRRLEEVAEAVGGGYCRLQMPLRLALGVRETVAGHRWGALEGRGVPPPLPMHP